MLSIIKFNKPDRSYSLSSIILSSLKEVETNKPLETLSNKEKLGYHETRVILTIRPRGLEWAEGRWSSPVGYGFMGALLRADSWATEAQVLELNRPLETIMSPSPRHPPGSSVSL